MHLYWITEYMFLLLYLITFSCFYPQWSWSHWVYLNKYQAKYSNVNNKILCFFYLRVVIWNIFRNIFFLPTKEIYFVEPWTRLPYHTLSVWNLMKQQVSGYKQTDFILFALGLRAHWLIKFLPLFQVLKIIVFC